MPTISLRKALTGSVSLVAGVALFGAGYVAANAGDDGDSQPARQRAGGNTIITPGLAGGGDSVVHLFHADHTVGRRALCTYGSGGILAVQHLLHR